MAQTTSETTQLETQYAAQLTTDLERNTKEQERISAEVTALEEQLRSLQRDQTLLVNLRQALGDSPVALDPVAPVTAPAAQPVPRQASARNRKTPPAKPKKTAAISSSTKAAAPGKKPTLVSLIREHLGKQTEPRSAAELTAALAQAHPARDIKPKVVRVTVEGLVAKGQVHRSKQGSSVFYAAAEPGSGTNTGGQDAK